MCLAVNRENPLKGKYPLEFDEKGFFICWKVYLRFENLLYPFYQSSHGFVTNGWIVSDRESKELGKGYGDFYSNVNRMGVTCGIHVYTSKESAEKDFGTARRSTIVPVRCHRSQLIAVGDDTPQAAFMKVFLKKEDYDKAIKK